MRRCAPILLVALLACGGGEPPSTADNGGVFVFGRGSDSVGLDPALETDGESFKVCDNLYETLVTYAPGSTEVVLPQAPVSKA